MLPARRYLHRFSVVVALSVGVALAATTAQLYALLTALWPEHLDLGPVMAGQIEQESHWNVYAQGRGSFGLVQLLPSTWRYWTHLDSRLRGWKWPDRYNPQKQMTALILIDRYNWARTNSLADPAITNHTAFMLSAYNEGLGTLLRDVHNCARRSGCNFRLWFNNVETSPGLRHNRSINRYYVRHILYDLAPKYRAQPPFRSDIDAVVAVNE